MQYTYDSNIVSDLHKEAFGFRPGQGFMEAWADMRPHEKQEEWDSLIAAMEENSAREKEMEEANLVAFKDQLKAVMTVCNCNWKAAVRHLQDADGEKDLAHFLWGQGISMAKNTEITNQIRSM